MKSPKNQQRNPKQLPASPSRPKTGTQGQKKQPAKIERSVWPTAEASRQTDASERAESPMNAEPEREEDGYGRVSEGFRKIKRAEWNRWRILAKNKEFVWETFRLKYQLGQFVQEDLAQLREFFRPSFSVTPQTFPAQEQRINQVGNKSLGALLTRYAQYVLRYRILFTLDEQKPYFRTRGVGFWGNKFHVAIRGDQLEPIAGAPPTEEDRLVSDDFESQEISVPAGLRELMEKGQAKYVRVEDEDVFSLLHQITDFAYSPDEVTVIEYNSIFPHALYLVGENVPLNQVWPQLARVAAEFQRETGRDQRGARAEIRTLYAKLNTMVRGNSTMGAIAAKFVRPEVATAKKVASIQTHLSQLKAKLRE